MPIAIGAKNVFVAAPNTPLYPSAATNNGSKPNTGAIITPRLDPIANNGVTSPPWNPADKVKIVKFRRRKHSRKQQGHRQWFTEVKITGIQA